MGNNNYSDQIFINCPFDKEYLEIFKAIVFTILDCGFVPRCSLEINDATQFRLQAIIDLIGDCKYAVHDLSRIELDKKEKLPRFNMPFELGIFYGVRYYGIGKHKRKNGIILEKDKYRYRKFISDLSGIDVCHHGNSVHKVIKTVRDWLATSSRRSTIPYSTNIISRYKKFLKIFNAACKSHRVDPDNMPFVDVCNNMSAWLKLNNAPPINLIL